MIAPRRLLVMIAIAVHVAAGAAADEPRRAKLPAKFEEVEGVAALVGDSVITLGELRRAMGSQVSSQQAVPTDIEKPRSEAELRLQVLQSLVDGTLVLRAAKELGVTAEDREVDQQITDVKKRNSWDDDDLDRAVRQLGFAGAAAYRQHVRQELVRLHMLKIKLGSRLRIGEEEVQKVLELEHCNGTCEEEVRARHIMVGVRPDDSPRAVNAKREKAWKVHDLLVAGTRPFEALAEEFNDDRGAPDGDLGWQRRWTLEPSLAAKLWSLKKNDISAVVQTPYGFHVLQVLDRRKSAAKDKELLVSLVRNRLQEDQLVKLYKAWIEEMRRSTHIDVRIP
ncbi:MAG: peptidylprolyl isomerase [Deltaproteobacteria bacterium]|nr:peptidylprolyl isomerase [Deltaproteobacteria bacterium]